MDWILSKLFKLIWRWKLTSMELFWHHAQLFNTYKKVTLVGAKDGLFSFFERSCRIGLTPKLRYLLDSSLKQDDIYLVIFKSGTALIHILRRPQNLAKSPLIIWLAVHRTNNWWRFRKILWPSQNIWTLAPKRPQGFSFFHLPWVLIIHFMWNPLLPMPPHYWGIVIQS